jgi:hypothetical protein
MDTIKDEKPGNDQNGTDEHDERCTLTCLACFPPAGNLRTTGTAGRIANRKYYTIYELLRISLIRQMVRSPPAIGVVFWSPTWGSYICP